MELTKYKCVWFCPDCNFCHDVTYEYDNDISIKCHSCNRPMVPRLKKRTAQIDNGKGAFGQSDKLDESI